MLMLRLRHIALVLVAITASIGAEAASDPRQKLAEAVRLHQAGELAQAAAKYEALVADYPGIAEIRSNLGAVYAGLGRYDDAISQYRAALDARPNLPSVRLNLALAYYKSARFRAAAGELETVRASEPANEQALKLLADSYLNLGEYPRVVQLLAPLGEQVTASPLLSYTLGTAYVRAGQLEKGRPLIDRLFRDGESAEALMLLAAAQMQGHDYAGARDNLAKAVALNQELPTVHRAYAMALDSTGDQEGAKVEFERELERNPYDFESNLNLGAHYKKERQMDLAAKHLNLALRARPGNLAVRYQLATVYMATQRMDEAREELQSVLAEAPEFIEAHVSLATVYYRLKRKADGDKEREIVRELNAAKQATQPGTQAAEAAAHEHEAATP